MCGRGTADTRTVHRGIKPSRRPPSAQSFGGADGTCSLGKEVGDDGRGRGLKNCCEKTYRGFVALRLVSLVSEEIGNAVMGDAGHVSRAERRPRRLPPMGAPCPQVATARAGCCEGEGGPGPGGATGGSAPAPEVFGGRRRRKGPITS